MHSWLRLSGGGLTLSACVLSLHFGDWADLEEDCSIVVSFLDSYGAFLGKKSCTLERYTPLSVVSFCSWSGSSLDSVYFHNQTACWVL